MANSAPFRWPWYVVQSLLVAAVFTMAWTERGPMEPGGDPADVQQMVDSIRVAYAVPALGGAIVIVDDSAYASAGSGVRSIRSWARFAQEVLHAEAGKPTVVSAGAGRATTNAVVPIGGS